MDELRRRTIKPWWPVIIVLLVLVADQCLKYWIKTTFAYGEEKHIAGDWFILHFTENNGMAFGLEFSGNYGKLILTFFRIVAVAGIIWYMVRQYKKGAHRGFIISLALILAGAVGNIIDSVFYGVMFHDINRYDGGWFHGHVVDMLYFPVIHTHYPSWFPIYAGEEFIFFRPVFNLADSAISAGVISIFVFQRRFFKHHDAIVEAETEPENPTDAETTDAIEPTPES